MEGVERIEKEGAYGKWGLRGERQKMMAVILRYTLMYHT